MEQPVYYAYDKVWLVFWKPVLSKVEGMNGCYSCWKGKNDLPGKSGIIRPLVSQLQLLEPWEWYPIRQSLERWKFTFCCLSQFAVLCHGCLSRWIQPCNLQARYMDIIWNASLSLTYPSPFLRGSFFTTSHSRTLSYYLGHS